MNIGDIITIHPSSQYYDGNSYKVVKIGKKWIYIMNTITWTVTKVTRFSIMESGLWKSENKS